MLRVRGPRWLEFDGAAAAFAKFDPSNDRPEYRFSCTIDAFHWHPLPSCIYIFFKFKKKKKRKKERICSTFPSLSFFFLFFNLEKKKKVLETQIKKLPLPNGDICFVNFGCRSFEHRCWKIIHTCTIKREIIQLHARRLTILWVILKCHFRWLVQYRYSFEV